jgi:hypothetical protein
MAKVFLDPQDASDRLKERGLPIEASTLGKLRCIGGGPPFMKWGRKPRYSAELLDQWAEERLGGPRHSTSDSAAT